MKTNSAFNFFVLGFVIIICEVAGKTNTQDFFPVATNLPNFALNCGSFRDGTNYVVVYVSGQDIFGQRISPDGQFVGSPISISIVSGISNLLVYADTNITFPAVAIAAGRTNTLIVWSDYGKSETFITIFGRIWANNLGPVGNVFPLTSSVENPFGRAYQDIRSAASDGDNFLVIWSDDFEYPEQRNINGQFISSNGKLLGSKILLFSQDNYMGHGDLNNLALVWGKTNYLMAYQANGKYSYDEEYHTFVRTISKSGNVSNPVPINYTGSFFSYPLAIGFDGTNFLVVWNRSLSVKPHNMPDWNLCGRFISQDGTPLGTELTLVTEQGSIPSLGFDGNNYLLVWSYNGDVLGATDQTIHARFFDRSGRPVGPIFQPFPSCGNFPPLLPLNGVFFDGTQYLLSATYGTFVTNYYGAVCLLNGGDVYGRFFPRSAEPPEFISSMRSSGNFGAQIRLVPGVNYIVAVSTNLTDWSNVGILNSSETNLLNISDWSIDRPYLFYRLIVGFTTGANF